MNLGFFGCFSNFRSHFLLIGREAWALDGWREEDIFWPSQLKRSFNSSPVEGVFPSLSTVCSAYGGDLYPEGVLGLSHADVVIILFGLVLFVLSLGLCLLRFNFCFSA